jgi:NADPH:quinone reductase-like Zn-dependent oxidoreductase
MKAHQLQSHGNPGKFTLVDLPEPRLAPDEVLVDVKACGLNRLDLWGEEGGLPVPIALPRTLGSEIAGTIAKLGEDVDDWRLGARVAVQSNLFCGHCEFCLRGDESTCIHGKLLGIDRDGGFATHVAVPARALVPMPDGVDFKTSASLSLAGSTAMHMLTNRTEVQPGEWVLVMGGASGVGTYATQIARQLGARVIATASSESKRNFAQEQGAEFVIDSTDPAWPSKVREITQKRGVDLVVEHIGGETFEKCFQALARCGRIVTCGATSGREVSLNLWPFFVKQQQIIGSYGRNRADVEHTLQWAAEGKIKAVIDHVFPLEKLPDAFAALRSRKVMGKIVISP